MPAKRRGGQAWRADLRTSGAWLALGAPVVLQIGLLANGSMDTASASRLNIAMALLLSAALAFPSLRDDFSRIRGLAPVAVLFAIVVLVGFWTLTPYAPGGPNPTWAYLGISPGAATVDKSLTLATTVKLLGLAPVFLIGCILGAHDGRARVTLNALALLAALFAAWSFFVHVTGSGPEGRTPRLNSSFDNPNASATYFGAALLLTVGLLGRQMKKGGPKANLAPLASACLLLAACLLLTGSRGGAAATAVGFLILGVLHLTVGGAKPSRTLMAVCGAIALATVFIFFLGDLLLTRSLDVSQDADVRVRIFAPHWEAFLRSPWIGYGYGTFDLVNRTLINSQNFGVLWDIRAAHNVYLQWLEQGGLLGALPMFSAVAVVILGTLLRARGRRRMTSALYAAIAVSAVFLVHGLSDFALEIHGLAAFWTLILGLQFSLAQGLTRS
jgi:O-antigen ligase